MDATKTSGLGKMVNDGTGRNANCKVQVVDGHLCLFAIMDLPIDTELRYDYGIPDLPWRKVCSAIIPYTFDQRFYGSLCMHFKFNRLLHMYVPRKDQLCIFRVHGQCNMCNVLCMHFTWYNL